MGQIELGERTQRREMLAKARETARTMLRAGSTPEAVVARLRKEGLEQKQAERLVERVDDRLQDELQGRGRSVDKEEVGDGSCPHCGDRLRRGAKFCEACGAKVLDEEDRAWHRTQIEPHLVKGRKWIGAMAILYTLGGVAFYLITESTVVLAINLALALIHLGLWQWAKSNLLPAAVTALVLFVTVHLASAVLDPTSILSGLIIKIAFVVALTQTIRAGLQVRSLRGASA